MPAGPSPRGLRRGFSGFHRPSALPLSSRPALLDKYKLGNEAGPRGKPPASQAPEGPGQLPFRCHLELHCNPRPSPELLPSSGFSAGFCQLPPPVLVQEKPGKETSGSWTPILCQLREHDPPRTKKEADAGGAGGQDASPPQPPRPSARPAPAPGFGGRHADQGGLGASSVPRPPREAHAARGPLCWV